MRPLLRKALVWGPVTILLIGAANHFWLVQRHHLSPWLGGGFGMFSTTDVGSTRQVFVTAITRNGAEHPVTLREPLRDLMQRARGLPDRQRLATLAWASREALGDEGSGLDVAELAALRIEVWRTRFEPETLRPKLERLVTEQFEFDAGDG